MEAGGCRRVTALWALALALALSCAAAWGATPDPGDPGRGRALVVNRQQSLCLLCHHAPIEGDRFQGDLGPDLAGVGSRLDTTRLRQRLMEPQALNPATIMPAYGRTEGLVRVGAAWQARPLLNAQQIEDVVAWLSTLKD